MYELHQLLWDIRNRPQVRTQYMQDAQLVLDEYGLAGDMRHLMADLNFKGMYEAGVNPYLLYFCAIQLEVDRADYYAQLRGEKI